MSLAERATRRPDTIHGDPCSVGVLLASIDGDELAAFQLMLYGRSGLTEPSPRYRGWSEREIHEVVTDEGYSVAKSQINIHRGKKCRCYRDAA